MSARALTLVENSSPRGKKASTAKRLRAAIIEGTGGEGFGPYPPMPTHVQRAIDNKARMLADEAYDLIRESISMGIGLRCFRGASHENFDDDVALEIARKATLDGALTPIVRRELESARTCANALVGIAEYAQGEIDRVLRQINAK